MTSIIHGSASILMRLQAGADAAGAAAKAPNVDVPADRATPQPSRPRTATRHPRTQVMLGRLRTELGRIFRTPCTAGEAREEIADALTRAQLGGWSLPALDDPLVQRHADDSRSIVLVSHVIVINPWGAFRILDCLRLATPYFEMAGCTGSAFVSPRAMAAKDVVAGAGTISGCRTK